MRRMISQKLQDFIKKLFGIVDVEDEVVQFGKDIEIDGDVKVNGVENLTDKDGNPLDFGGDAAPIVDTEEIVHIEGEEGTELYLAQEVSNKVQNSLQLPVSPPLADALVGVGTNGAQKQIGVGDKLEIKNNVLNLITTDLSEYEYEVESDITTEMLERIKNSLFIIKGNLRLTVCSYETQVSNNQIVLVAGYYQSDCAELLTIYLRPLTNKIFISLIES